MADYKVLFLVGVLALSFSHREARGEFCDRLLEQLSGYDVFGGDEDAIDREALGDNAVRAGVRYLAHKVPISALPDILASPYLPRRARDTGVEPQILEPVGQAKIGYDVSVRLGGINLRLNRDEVNLGPEPEGPILLEANPNHNALLLYSPRVFSLTPWTYGNAVLMRNARDPREPGQLCAGWSCVTSNSSDANRNAAFQGMARDRDERWLVRADGPLPRYEIVGILIQPGNEHFANAVLDKYPGLAFWKNRLIFQSAYPPLDVGKMIYSPELLYEVALDISPVVERRAADREEIRTFVLSSAVTRFTSDFPEKIRALVSNRAAPNLDKILGKKDRNYNTWSGYSEYNIKMMTEMEKLLSQGGKTDGRTVPKLLPGAKLYRVGYIEVNTIREWVFIIAEYKARNGEKRLVLFVRNRGEKNPPPDVPYRVWGIGRYDDDSLGINWEWIPE